MYIYNIHISNEKQSTACVPTVPYFSINSQRSICDMADHHACIALLDGPQWRAIVLSVCHSLPRRQLSCILYIKSKAQAS